MKKVQLVGIVITLALVLMAFNVDSVAANPGSRSDSLNLYMDEHFDATEGGFALAEGETSQLFPSFGATIIYDDQDILDLRPPTVDVLKLKNFTRKLQWKSGGEDYDRYGALGLYIAGPVSTMNTYHGLRMWEILETQTGIPNIEDIKINKTSALVYINKTQSETGGFGIHEDESPNMLSTFYSLYSLIYLVSDAEIEQSLDTWLWNETATIEWILSCREGDVFKLSPVSEIGSLAATSAAIMALDLLNSLSSISDLENIQNWIVDRQVMTLETGSFVGGFEESYLTNDTNILSTYYALEALDTLGVMNLINASAAAQFIVDCQAVDGAWGLVPGQSTGELYYAALAFQSLRLLDESGTYSNLLLEEDPNNPSPFFIDWRVLFVVAFILIAAVVGIYSLRLD
ncbi:MAG: prenyltransferase/squalene oxidase repeat-containing protein [Candidatus Thorarchaeota archaeon]